MKSNIGDLIKIYLTKFLNIFRFLIYKIIDLFLSIQQQKTHQETLLLIRLDSIGDYVLIRNYFYYIKQSKKYQNYKITLCGNDLWKDLAVTFDSNIIDEFIWLNRKKFSNNPFYKYKLLKNIYKSGFEVVIDTTFSREILFGDSIVNTSRAKDRIGSTGSPDSYVRRKRNLFTNRFYTNLLPQSSKNYFEFYRNKELFENMLQEHIELNMPHLDCSEIEINLPTPKEFAIIFPGAQEEKRKWSSTNFEVVVEYLIQNYNLNVIIAGSKSDSAISRKMVKCRISKSCFDMTGKTTLPQLVKLISLATILVSNETSAVHFAAAVGVPFICVSNGNHFGRFNPYPKEMNIKSKYFYPEDIEKNLDDLKYLEKYRFDSDLDINSISPNKILKALTEFL
jgi:ADP-heptose:LPS heptosyltransferase